MQRRNTQKAWFAVRTRPRAEKKAESALKQSGFTVYLPLQKNLKQWSDRKKWVQEPLIRSYIFVYIAPEEEYQVTCAENVSTIIKFNGQPAPIPDEQINMLRSLTSARKKIEVTNETFKKGEKVEITSGKLSGFTGELVDHYGKNKVLLRLNTVDKGLLINIRASDLQKITDETLINNL